MLPALALLFCAPALAQPTGPAGDREAPGIQLRPELEAGFLGVLSHKLQLDSQGTWFDLKQDGGQSTLFPFYRLAADLTLGGRHHLDLVMQPLDLRSEVYLEQDLVVDEALFPATSAVDIRYGFDFYRATYRYDLLPDRDRELSLGGGLQLRDADIIYTSGDGSLRRANRNVGPVPLLSAQWEQRYRDGYWLGLDASGFYASFKVLNGSAESEVTGAIYDTSLKLGFDVRGPVDGWLNVRFVGGGAEGTSANPDGPSDGYTRNWLHITTVSLGLALDPRKLGTQARGQAVQAEPPARPPRQRGPQRQRPPR